MKARSLSSMRLGIVSDGHHYVDAEGRLCTLTPLRRQLERWASLFAEVTVCAPLLPGAPPPTHTPYVAGNVRLLPVSAAGGTSVAAKARLVARLPGWWAALRRLLAGADAVHVRCPANVAIPALLAMRGFRGCRQAVYTGTWTGYPGESATYRWQRRFLATRFRGPVAVYGAWPGQPPHVVPTFSPSYAAAEWEAEAPAVERRLARLAGTRALPRPVRLLSVGRLDRNKSHDTVLHAVSLLAGRGVDATLEVVGDGPERAALEALAREAGVAGRVRFHGRLGADAVRERYREADLVVQAPRLEGYGKVPVEAFFHGVVPVLSDVGVSAQLVGHGERGRVFPPGDAAAAAAGVEALAGDAAMVAAMVERGRAHARTLTLEAWTDHLREMLTQHWKVEP